MPSVQSSLLTQPDKSAKALHKSLVSSGNNLNVGYQQLVLAKLIALRDTLVAANQDLAMNPMIGSLCAAFVALNPNSVINVDYKEADGEKVLRRFFLYPGSHDKVIDCLLSCWSADACHLKALLFKQQIFRHSRSFCNRPSFYHCLPLLTLRILRIGSGSFEISCAPSEWRSFWLTARFRVSA